jgi:hypothetical protein
MGSNFEALLAKYLRRLSLLIAFRTRAPFALDEALERQKQETDGAVHSRPSARRVVEVHVLFILQHHHISLSGLMYDVG